jgi:hypothetical protein
MDSAKYEYQSEFARRYFSEGKAEGKAEVVLKQLALRFGPLAEDLVERVRAASAAELDVFAERLLTARRIEDVLIST